MDRAGLKYKSVRKKLKRVSINMVLDFTSPQEFFHNELKSAQEASKKSLSQDLEFYVVNLLCTFIVPEKLVLSDGEYNPLNTPLAILFQKAVDAPVEERLRILKSVGDTSLYLSGFFQDYFNRKTFSLDYFVSVGVSAYSNVSNITRVSKNSKNSYFYNLFICLVLQLYGNRDFTGNGRKLRSTVMTFKRADHVSDT